MTTEQKKYWANMQNTCECGGQYSNANKQQHYQSKKHLKYQKTIDEENIKKEITFNHETELKNMEDDTKMMKELHENSKQNIQNHEQNMKKIKKWEKVIFPDAKTRYALNDNEICFCLCGGKFIRHNKARHEKTEKHIKFIGLL